MGTNNCRNQEIYEYLKSIGCCEICCLRYFKARGTEYEDLDDTFIKLGISNIHSTSAEHQDEKKQRLNPCSACLGLFSSEFLEMIINKITTNSDLTLFDCEEIVLAISFPILLQIRSLVIWLSLIEKFGNSMFSSEKAPDVPLKEAAKLIINPKIYKNLNKKLNPNGIMINLFFSHEDELPYVKNILEIEKLSKRTKNKMKKIEITRAMFEKNYQPKNLEINEFRKYFSVPSEIPTSSLILDKISIQGPTVFLAGRYRKLSRELSHSPWVLNGKRVMEDSIQEIIIRSSANYFGVPEEKIVFSSSGREDVDVRCLGNGRPFVLEIPNSKRIRLPKKIAAEIEIEIEKSLRVSVNNLQMVQREDLIHIKTGEETKRKFYRALCILKEPATIEILKKLNIPDGFKIYQITPLRVLHRRPLHSRPRMIYSVKCAVCSSNQNVIILDIVTQAGTYVKELVHGEFGRTNPSISSIIQKPIDIIALDVIGIDLNWPPEVNNQL